MTRLLVALLTICCLWFGSVRPAAAQPVWEPEWNEFGVPHAVVTGAFGGLALTAALIGGPETPRWQREILLDLPVRRAIGSKASGGERRAALVSDLTVGLLMAGPFIEAGVSRYLTHRDAKFAKNYGLYSLQSFAVALGVTNLVKVLVGRARPDVAECFALRETDPDAPCEPRHNVSFFSGHSAVAFTGAGLICAFGNRGALYGRGVKGKLPCVAALALATTTAALRLVANKHHFSDVALGTVVGVSSGWLLPLLQLGAR